MKKDPFWKTKSLNEMTQDEWESLCDGCGICCLKKIEDEETGEVRTTSVSCDFLETVSCRCMVYVDRMLVNPDCIALSAGKLTHIEWLPDTCAYVRLAEGRDLEWWHPLISGDSNTVHKAGVSVRDRVVQGKYVQPKDIVGDQSV